MSSLLIIHIIIAITSLLVSGYTVFFPTKRKLTFNYILISLVIGSGVYLTLVKPSHLPQTCMTGLAYLGVVTFLLIMANRRLAASLVHEE